MSLSPDAGPIALRRKAFMTVIDDPVRQQASREATQWLILLQEEPDDPEVRAGFEAWLDAAPVNREAWAQTQTAMGLVNYLSPDNTGNWQQKSVISFRCHCVIAFLHEQQGPGLV